MHELQQWLTTNPRDYARGVYLYELYGPYKSVLALLQKGETDLTRSKLNEVLREVWQELEPQLANRATAVIPPLGGKVAAVTSAFKNQKSKIDLPDNAAAVIPPLGGKGVDTVLTRLDSQWKPLYAEMGLLHARLAMCSTDEQRYKLAGQILNLEQQIITIWQQRDEYLQTGKLPAAKPRKVVNTAHLTSNQHRQLTNLRTYISRMERSVLPGLTKKQAEKPTKRRALRIKENEDKLAGWKQQLNQLEHG